MGCDAKPCTARAQFHEAPAHILHNWDVGARKGWGRVASRSTSCCCQATQNQSGLRDHTSHQLCRMDADTVSPSFQIHCPGPQLPHFRKTNWLTGRNVWARESEGREKKPDQLDFRSRLLNARSCGHQTRHPRHAPWAVQNCCTSEHCAYIHVYLNAGDSGARPQPIALLPDLAGLYKVQRQWMEKSSVMDSISGITLCGSVVSISLPWGKDYLNCPALWEGCLSCSAFGGGSQLAYFLGGLSNVCCMW